MYSNHPGSPIYPSTRPIKPCLPIETEGTFRKIFSALKDLDRKLLDLGDEVEKRFSRVYSFIDQAIVTQKAEVQQYAVHSSRSLAEDIQSLKFELKTLFENISAKAPPSNLAPNEKAASVENGTVEDKKVTTSTDKTPSENKQEGSSEGTDPLGDRDILRSVECLWPSVRSLPEADLSCRDNQGRILTVKPLESPQRIVLERTLPEDEEEFFVIEEPSLPKTEDESYNTPKCIEEIDLLN